MASLNGRRWALLGVSIAIAGLAGAARFSMAAGKAGAAKPSPLVGAWRIVSVEEVQPNGTIKTDWMGPRPAGLIVYDRSGYMSAQLGRDPRAIWTSPNVEKATTEERAKAFDAYYVLRPLRSGRAGW
jgi:hypothetical protein